LTISEPSTKTASAPTNDVGDSRDAGVPLVSVLELVGVLLAMLESVTRTPSHA
jgi:hypothetical protein